MAERIEWADLADYPESLSGKHPILDQPEEITDAFGSTNEKFAMHSPGMCIEGTPEQFEQFALTLLSEARARRIEAGAEETVRLGEPIAIIPTSEQRVVIDQLGPLHYRQDRDGSISGYEVIDDREVTLHTISLDGTRIAETLLDGFHQGWTTFNDDGQEINSEGTVIIDGRTLA